MRSLWRPAWYELDQALEVDVEDDFAFCIDTPRPVPTGYDLVFHNPLLDSRDALLRRARIVHIHHPTLGDIQRIDTKGLVYVLTLVGGEQVHVDAEETPGTTESSSGASTPSVQTWDFDVTLAVAKA